MSNATRSSAPARPRSTLAGRASLPGRTGADAISSRRTASSGPSPSEIVQPCCSAQPCAPTRSVSERNARSIRVPGAAGGPSPERGPPVRLLPGVGRRRRRGRPGRPAGGSSRAAPRPADRGSPARPRPPARRRPRCSGSRQSLPLAGLAARRRTARRGPGARSSIPCACLAVRVARPPPAHRARTLLPDWVPSARQRATGSRRPRRPARAACRGWSGPAAAAGWPRRWTRRRSAARPR